MKMPDDCLSSAIPLFSKRKVEGLEINDEALELWGSSDRRKRGGESKWMVVLQEAPGPPIYFEKVRSTTTY
jgi:hypothetical protein